MQQEQLLLKWRKTNEKNYYYDAKFLIMSPTQRSLNKLRKEGWEVCIVEKWIPQARRRVDAFGFGDILGYHVFNLKLAPYTTTALFQVTSGSNFSARIKKILEDSKAKGWLKAGNGICVHGWRKLKNKETGKYHWECKEQWITLENFKNEIRRAI